MKLTTALVVGAQAFAALVSAENIAISAAPEAVQTKNVQTTIFPAIPKDVSGKPAAKFTRKPFKYTGKPRFTGAYADFLKDLKSKKAKSAEKKERKDTTGAPKNLKLNKDIKPVDKMERKDTTGEPKELKLTKEAEKKERKECVDDVSSDDEEGELSDYSDDEDDDYDTTGKPKVTCVHGKQHDHAHHACTGKPQVDDKKNQTMKPFDTTGAPKVTRAHRIRTDGTGKPQVDDKKDKKVKPLTEFFEGAEKVKAREGSDKKKPRVQPKEATKEDKKVTKKD